MFTKMSINNNIYTINNSVRFNPIGKFHLNTIQRVFNFAYDMSFGKNGEHRDHRSGGTHRRRNGEIFANTFQGKLAECAIYNYFYNSCDITEPDFDTYGLGEWDNADFYINNYNVSIKSTKSFGNLLLLETKDWDENGVYLPNDEAYDFTFLVRLNPYCEDIMRSNRILYSDDISANELEKLIIDNSWVYDIPGYITLDDLKYIIQNDYVIPQGAMLNGRTRMDATNYYVQSGDMHLVNNFIGEL